MRHAKHRHQLGVKTAHRAALLSNMAASLLRHGRIRTTLAKAKALRPFTEKVITTAKKARKANDPQKALHYRRQALTKVRSPEVVQYLFNELVDQFLNREGGYTRIYKLIPRTGDGAEMALIELISASDEGYSKRRKPSRKKAKATATAPAGAGASAKEAPESEPESEEPKAEAEEMDTPEGSDTSDAKNPESDDSKES